MKTRSTSATNMPPADGRPGKVYFVGAGPGDPELITVKGKRLLESATVVLYTGSLVPEQLLQGVPSEALIRSSEDMSYEEIFDFIEGHCHDGVFVRLHTGDPALYSTIAKQIEFLKAKGIDFEVIPGVSAAFAAAASLGLEYTIPGVSQTLILSRVPGKTPNPEQLAHLLRCRHSSHVFYLSALLAESLKEAALREGWPSETPCVVVERASWPDERKHTTTLGELPFVMKACGVRGHAIILLGDFLEQRESEGSFLYSCEYGKND